jgi:hypothetical protein
MLFVEIHAQTAATHHAVPIGAGGSAPDVRKGALGGRRAGLDVVTSGSGSGRAFPARPRTQGRVDTKDFASYYTLHGTPSSPVYPMTQLSTTKTATQAVCNPLSPLSNSAGLQATSVIVRGIGQSPTAAHSSMKSVWTGLRPTRTMRFVLAFSRLPLRYDPATRSRTPR